MLIPSSQTPHRSNTLSTISPRTCYTTSLWPWQTATARMFSEVATFLVKLPQFISGPLLFPCWNTRSAWVHREHGSRSGINILGSLWLYAIVICSVVFPVSGKAQIGVHNITTCQPMMHTENIVIGDVTRHKQDSVSRFPTVQIGFGDNVFRMVLRKTSRHSPDSVRRHYRYTYIVGISTILSTPIEYRLAPLLEILDYDCGPNVQCGSLSCILKLYSHSKWVCNDGRAVDFRDANPCSLIQTRVGYGQLHALFGHLRSSLHGVRLTYPVNRKNHRGHRVANDRVGDGAPQVIFGWMVILAGVVLCICGGLVLRGDCRIFRGTSNGRLVSIAVICWGLSWPCFWFGLELVDPSHSTLSPTSVDSSEQFSYPH